MKMIRPFALLACALVLVLSSACGGVQIEDREVLVDGKLPRPDHIWVFDFSATLDDVPGDSALAQSAGSSQTPEQIALGRQVGAEIAKALVTEIRAMRLSAVPATDRTQFKPNDIVIRGYRLSVDSGSATERVAIGLGQGAAELRVAVEGFEVTPDGGLRKLGSGTLDTEANKTPGAAIPLAITIATKNPLGLIVSTGVKVHDEVSGSATIVGKAQAVAKKIGEALRPPFEAQGWILPK